ncbi:ATP-binding protein [Desulfuromonas sp. TF]|uniref:sensor histidine kinase n=1 Tax=Desulfuromonas sp. TF TaxID=1232410 RepID=UPI0006891823|nr:ATP-binding protein [Desulfuromonas sp. TF]
MKKDKRSLEPAELRRRAEEALREKAPARLLRAGDDPEKLLHELQVHQIELEMQNHDLRHARDEMEVALEKYTDLYDFAPVGYATLDDAGIIRGINLTGADLLGMERSLLIGRPFALFFAAESLSDFKAFLGRIMTGQGKEVCEGALAGNGKAPLIVRIEAVAGASGQEHRMAFFDITERKRIEKEVLRLHEKLERRAYELEAANLELEAFSHTVAHDLRSPLTVIGGYCQVIQELGGESLDERCRGYLRKVGQGVQRMSELIDTLLNFSRLTHSKLRPETVDLSEMARSVASELGKEHPDRLVAFRIEPGVSVQGDPKLLQVVLNNLLGNAWKYTGKKDDAVIEFGATEAAGKSRVCFVRDNGPGFDIAHVDLLFRAFERLPGSQEFQGFGLGLATVQRIVQMHGGRVWAEGEVEKGATFYFTLD